MENKSPEISIGFVNCHLKTAWIWEHVDSTGRNALALTTARPWNCPHEFYLLYCNCYCVWLWLCQCVHWKHREIWTNVLSQNDEPARSPSQFIFFTVSLVYKNKCPNIPKVLWQIKIREGPFWKIGPSKWTLSFCPKMTPSHKHFHNSTQNVTIVRAPTSCPKRAILHRTRSCNIIISISTL